MDVRIANAEENAQLEREFMDRYYRWQRDQNNQQQQRFREVVHPQTRGSKHIHVFYLWGVGAGLMWLVLHFAQWIDRLGR